MRHVVGLPPAPTSPRDARLFVSHWTRQWGYQRLLGPVALLTSELATNAVLHAGTSFEVSATNLGSGVRVTVWDGSPAAPAVRDPAKVDATGRGLRLVDSISAHWGWERDPDRGGKQVWFELDAASPMGDSEPAG